uniref:transposase n=1 Tax=Xanthomonas axonopodis TaxID=53413 RepID=UPI0013DD9D2A|nr:transposase [Xanthomonas axonopodis]
MDTSELAIFHGLEMSRKAWAYHLAHALRVISDWIGFYNRQRPLKMMTPDQAYAATLTN